MAEIAGSAYPVLSIFDIDGVFFEGFRDIRTYTSIVSNSKLSALKSIAKFNTDIWIFTDRDRFGYWGQYKSQFQEIIRTKTDNPFAFDSSEEFIKQYDFSIHRSGLIMKAGKPGIFSQSVIKIALMNYNNIFYFAGKDLPWTFRDEELIKSLSKKNDTTKIRFISIG